MARAARRRLFLIDGYALIYRAFYAMIGRPLTTSRGENTSAVWGVANFLLRLFDEHAPDYVAWVHDAGTSFRHEVFPDYKATREKLEPELQQDFDRSVERVHQLLAAFRIPLIAVDGYEADDVIGTLATRAAEQGLEAVIVSGDKDFHQLVAPGVALLNPGRGGPAGVEEHWVDERNAAERLGVPPERVVDYLALVGDSSDNIPGVKGVGDKTARQLIEAYGGLEDILAHADEVKGKRAREALHEHADAARLSRELVTIRRDVPVELALEGLAVSAPDREGLAALFADLEFHSLLPKIQVTPRTAPPPEEAPFELVTDPGHVASVVEAARRAAPVAIRVELSGPDPMRATLIGLSLAAGGGRAWYFPFAHRAAAELGAEEPRNLPPLDDEALRPLRQLLEDAAVPKAGHDVKGDWLALRRAGIELRGVAYDSMLAAFLLDPGRRSNALDVIALERFGVRLTMLADLVGRGKTERVFAEIDPAEAGRYACAASDMVLRLHADLATDLERHGLSRLLEDVELPLIEVLVDMEHRGIAIDLEGLRDLSRQFGQELSVLEQEIYRAAGTDFNINSTPQLRHVLFEKLQLPVLKRTKTGASTDADVLQELATMGFDVPALLIEYRELAKLRSTYVDALPGHVHPETGRIHTTFHQTGAQTGRLSSSEPNLQNIPVRTRRGGEIRRCFVPAKGCRFVAADYSQVELRILAHLSGDEAFIRAFRRGGDIHRETAAIIFDVPVDAVAPDMRARAKTINFATIYGQGPFALSRQLGISRDDAKAFIMRYFERFAGVRRFLDQTIAQARERGYVETLFGRRRYIPELRDKAYNVRAFGERTAMNSPIQGSAADLIKIAMLRVARALRTARVGGGMVVQVHDELVLEVPEAAVRDVQGLVREAMEGAADLAVPLVVDVGAGDNWLDAKE